MINRITMLIIVIIQAFYNYSIAQNNLELGDGKIVDILQNAPDSLLPVYIGYVTNMRDGWEESSTQTNTIVYAGPGCYFDPTLFMRLNQNQLIFTTGLAIPQEIQIKYGEGSWADVDIFYYSDLGQYGSDQLSPPWNETGEYEIQFRWESVNEIWHNHFYSVHAVPSVDLLFIDDDKNRI